MKKDIQLLNLKDFDRPFVCDGNPLDCEVFIVGFNPATEMKEEFKQFYTNSIFNKEAFDIAYQGAKKEKSKDDSEKEKYSRTREALRTIVSNFPKNQILQTNIYFKPTSRAKDLKKEERNPEQFLSLIEQFKRTGNPKVIYVHGSKTIKHFVKALGLKGDFTIKNEDVKSTKIDYKGQSFILVWTYHLSFQKMVTETMLNNVVNKIKASIK